MRAGQDRAQVFGSDEVSGQCADADLTLYNRNTVKSIIKSLTTSNFTTSYTLKKCRVQRLSEEWQGRHHICNVPSPTVNVWTETEEWFRLEISVDQFQSDKASAWIARIGWIPSFLHGRQITCYGWIDRSPRRLHRLLNSNRIEQYLKINWSQARVEEFDLIVSSA